MKRIRNVLKRCRSGQTTIEYLLVVGLLAAGVIAAGAAILEKQKGDESPLSRAFSKNITDAGNAAKVKPAGE
jgi:hypothetical protein